jgi:hypothetical protein
LLPISTTWKPEGTTEMKIKFDIDCTPEEARTFLGLPDVKPMQEELLKHLQERMTTALNAMDADAMFKTWLPATLKGFEHWQEMFLQQLGTGKPAHK